MLYLLFQENVNSKSAAHALLDLLLLDVCSLPSPIFSSAPGGKPVLERAPFHFNISHSGSFALCGVGDAPLGVDVESIRPRRAGLPRYVLSDIEFDWFTSCGSRWEDFYTLWTLKESRVKYTGQGLDCAARSIPVPLLSPGESACMDGLWFRAFAGPGWRGACCAEERPPELVDYNSLPCSSDKKRRLYDK